MSLLNKIKRNSFLVIGRAGMDFCPEPAGTATKNATSFFASLGGSSANIAVALSKLGGNSALVTPVSRDAVGEFCLHQLQNYGVSTEFVTAVEGEYRTSLAVYESRVENHQSVIYRNGAADFQLTSDDVAKPDYSNYGAVITTGTVFAAEPSRSAGYKGMELANTAGIPVVFDIDYRPYSWTSPELAAQVLTKAGEMSDIIIGNDVEFDFMAGGTGLGLEFARQIGQSPDKIIVYKMGELGSITITGGQEFRTGIYKVTALKPTGAGDSFMGGFIASMAQGLALRDCVLRGSACASIVVSSVGCSVAMPNPKMLEDFLSNHPGPTMPKDV